MQGTVKWFSDEKGYGFITPDTGTKDYFVHYTGILGPKGQRRNLHDGQRVKFDIGQGEKGPAAINVEAV